MLQVCGSFCAFVSQTRKWNKRQGEEKRQKKTNQAQATCKVSQCARLLQHLCWRSVKTDIFFHALWHVAHTCTEHRAAQSTFARPGRSMESEGVQIWPFYFGRIGSQATERILERFGQDGSFLLRDSDTVQGLYCLCVRWAANPLPRPYFLIIVLPEHFACIVRDKLLTWRKFSPCH